MSRPYRTEFPPARGDQPYDVRRERSNVNGRRIIVTPSARAPWWRRERAYRRRGVEHVFSAPPGGERALMVALWLGSVYVAARVIEWWTR